MTTGYLTDPRFDISNLSDTLSRRYGVGSDADLPDALRFIRGVVDLARTRFRAKNEPESDQPIVFLLHPEDAPDISEPRSRGKRVPMLDEAEVPIAGQVWFVNHVVNDGMPIGLLDHEDDADVFKFVEHELCLGDLTAGVIVCRDGAFSARYYPNGLSDKSACQRVDLNVANLSPQDVHDVIQGIYEAELCSPEAQGHVVNTWQDAGKFVPVLEAELTVQRIIKVGLTGRYLGLFDVQEEQPSPSGRYDLMIQQSDVFDRTVTTNHLLIELKVLRDVTSGSNPVQASKNRAAVKKGLKQAAVYRDKRHARAAALCCFDMRKKYTGSDIFTEFEAKARGKDVHLWLWHLFNSSEAYRDHNFDRDEQANDVTTDA